MALKNKPISDQVALVTGGGTGIGRAFTEALAAAGARVVIASRREEVIRRTAEELNLKLGAERGFPYAIYNPGTKMIDAPVGHVLSEHEHVDLSITNHRLALSETADPIIAQ